MLYTRYVGHGTAHRAGTSSLRQAARNAATRTRLVCVCTVQDDLYSALGITRSANKAQIKAAYRRAVRDCHPDVNPSLAAAKRFQVGCRRPSSRHLFTHLYRQLLQDAYDVLLDERTRQRYNQQLDNASKRSSSTSTPLCDRSQHRTCAHAGNGTDAPTKGRDVHTVVGLDLLEAVRGIEKVVSVMVLDTCPSCEVRRAYFITPPKVNTTKTQRQGDHVAMRSDVCQLCKGSGEVLTKRMGVGSDGAYERSAWRSCPGCGGGGSSMRQYCSRCGGQGMTRVARGVRVTFPAGVDTGNVLRMRGQGDQGRAGGAPGDAYIAVKVHEHPQLWRRGMDLFSPLRVCYTDAILGATVTVTTVWGPRTLVVPPGTQHGALLGVTGAGMRRVTPGGVSLAAGRDDGGGVEERGQHFFEVCVQVPTSDALSAQELAHVISLQGLLRGASSSPDS